MERLLKGEPKRRPVIAWLYWPAGIAAGLLIFFSLWYSGEPATELAKNDGKGSIKTENISREKKTPESENQKPGNTKVANSSTFSKTELSNSIIAKQKQSLNKFSVSSNLSDNTINLSNAAKQGQEIIISGKRDPLPAMNYAANKDLRIIHSLSSDPLSANAERVPLNDSIMQRLESHPAKKDGKWGLSMAFTTDMNSVNGIGNSKAGLSGGFGISYKVSKGISAGTGLYYSRKKYTSDKYAYNTTEKPFATWASYSRQIDADCKVIDIPLNLNILLSKTKKTGIIASAGVSSYIILSEKYNFIYNPTPSYPSAGREYTIKNANQNILSVVNLSVGVEKPLGKQSSIVIQPYAKLPLSGIGQGETELKSFGVGFQLNYSVKKKNKFFNRKSE
jgi:hypothetical protein